MEEPAAVLPDDVVLEVVARVADVPTLFRFATAAKCWRELIGDRSFLRRRWPENSTHTAFLAGFFTQRLCLGSEDDENPFIHECKADRDSPPVFIPAPSSMLGPGFRSLASGIVDGAKPLTARRGLLLVRLAPVLEHAVVIRLAICDLLAGTCDELPPLPCNHNWAPESYVILTGEDCRPPDGHRPRSTLVSNYSTFFKVLAMGFVCNPCHGDVEYNMCTFSSAGNPGWISRPKRLGLDYRCPWMQYDAAVGRHGISHWLCNDWWSDNDDPSKYFTISVSPKDGHVSLAKLSFLANRPTADAYHLATVDGTLSLFLLYTGNEGLWLDSWARRDGTQWHRTRVTELKPPEHRRIESVIYLWLGEKSGTLLIIDSKGFKYVIYLETGAMQEISSQFSGMVGDAVPMEIEWPDLFMSRLTGGLHKQREKFT
ncbi:unnamed protein product [Alopecurus aequalis]